ncbi:response regulator [Roseivivax sp. CAU 1761]
MREPNKVTFLVVDDDEVSVMAIKRAIGKLRLTNPIEVAGDGVEALERLRDRGPERIRRPYIVLLDLNMPRMGGLEFLATVRRDAELQNAVVFVLTTSDAPEDVASAYQHKVAGYILKEDTFGSLKNAVDLLGAYIEIVQLPRQAAELALGPSGA